MTCARPVRRPLCSPVPKASRRMRAQSNVAWLLFPPGSDRVCQEAQARTRLCLTQNHESIAWLELVQPGRPAVKANQRAGRGIDVPLATTYARDIQRVWQDLLDRAGKAAFRRDALSSCGWPERRPSSRGSRGGRRHDDRLRTCLVGPDRRGGDEDARGAHRRGQMQAESFEPGRHGSMRFNQARRRARGDVGPRDTTWPVARISSVALTPAAPTSVHGITSLSAARTSPGANVKRLESLKIAATTS